MLWLCWLSEPYTLTLTQRDCVRICFTRVGVTTLEWSDKTKDLGITMDSHLEFNQHIANIVHSAHIRANLILKSFVSRDREVLIKAFVTIMLDLF